MPGFLDFWNIYHSSSFPGSKSPKTIVGLVLCLKPLVIQSSILVIEHFKCHKKHRFVLTMITVKSRMDFRTYQLLFYLILKFVIILEYIVNIGCKGGVIVSGSEQDIDKSSSNSHWVYSLSCKYPWKGMTPFLSI